jgi:hypothetical protein
MSSQPSSARPALMVLRSQTKDTGAIIFSLKQMNWVDKPPYIRKAKRANNMIKD